MATSELQDRVQRSLGSSYVIELSERVAIDAARTNTADGRLLNDARGSGLRANVRFVANHGGDVVYWDQFLNW